MALLLGDTAPDFTADSTTGRVSLYDHMGGGWAVLFSHPADFTPVCTTELASAERHRGAFEARGCRLLALSVDPVEDHLAWLDDIEDIGGCRPGFPLVADPDRSISTAYGMLHPNADSTMTVRSVFIIGPDRTIKLSLAYPASTGRDFGELLRVFDSLKLTAEHKLATPADWRRGDDCVIVPSVSDEEALGLFPGGFESRRPYFRTTACPA